MNILIVGCGKTGSQLCNKLSELGHDVSVIDRNPEAFHNLADDFTGYTVTGVPIDQDVLRRGGIEGCDAVAAVTEDDNTNVMVCQVASDIFKVPRVLARVFDPRRGRVFSEFGLHTVCPTNLSVDAIHSMLTDHDTLKNVYLDSATIAFETIKAAAHQVGLELRQLCVSDGPGYALFGLLHADGNLTLAYGESKLKVLEDDRLIFARVVD